MNENKRYYEIEVIKYISIMLILVNHSLFNRVFLKFYIAQIIYSLIIGLSVRIFLIIMGIVMSFSLKKQKRLYSKRYFKSKIKRFIIPFIPIFLISLFLSLILYKTYYIGLLSFYGCLSVYCAGNYFISLIFQFILCFPLIYYFYKKNWKLTIILSFIISIMFQILCNSLFDFSNVSFKISVLYQGCILRFLPCFTLGIFISENYQKEKLKLFIKQNRFILIGIIISIFFTIFHLIKEIKILYIRIFYDILTVFYPLLIILLIIEYFPNSKENRLIILISKASYHIFLFQIIYFSFRFNLTIENIHTNNLFIKIIFLIIINITNIVYCLLFGILYYYIDIKTINKRK